MSLFPCAKYYEKKNTESCFRLVNNQAQPMSHSFLTIGVTPVPSGGYCPSNATCCSYDKNVFDKANQITCKNNPEKTCVTDADCPSSDFCNTCKQGQCQFLGYQCVKSKKNCLPDVKGMCGPNDTCGTKKVWMNNPEFETCYQSSDCAPSTDNTNRCSTEIFNRQLNGAPTSNKWLSGFVCSEQRKKTVVANCTFGPTLPPCKPYEKTTDSSDGCFPTFWTRTCTMDKTTDKTKEECYANTPATKYAAWSNKDKQCFRFPDSCSIVPDANYDLTYSR